MVYEQCELPSSVGLNFLAQRDDSRMYSRHLELVSSRMINGVPCGLINMAIKDLDMEPKIDAIMRRFLNSSWWEKLSKEAGSEILLDGSRQMIPEPGDTNRDVPVNETFHVQTDDELTKKELKQIEADDQAIQTILLGLLEDIYTAIDSCETAQEIWLRVQQTMKGFDIGIQEKKTKNKHFPEKIANNLKFLNNLQPEWSRHVTIVHQTKDLHTADYTQLYDFLKYNQKEVDELKAKRLAKTQDPLALMENSNNPYAFPAPHQDQPYYN
uniref:Gag-Pol polyprotein n=1 Tax=Tanacetum cinerariifolium TaxID=118510 RepID=A0A699HIQ5_TANCI|nr:hypothetical protein [Tanacetum cinerariifolium]